MTNNLNIGKEKAIRQAVKLAVAGHYGRQSVNGSAETTLQYNKGENSQRIQASELRIQHEFEERLKIEKNLAYFDRLERRDYDLDTMKCVEDSQESRTRTTPESQTPPMGFYFKLDHSPQEDKPNTDERTGPSIAIRF